MLITSTQIQFLNQILAIASMTRKKISVSTPHLHMVDNQQSASLVVCCTALNYVYASLSGMLGIHDVICLNKDTADWITRNAHVGLRKVVVCNFKKLTLRSNLNYSDYNTQKRNLNNPYDQVFLSFSSGWHFVWINRLLAGTSPKMIFLDDGLGNLTELDTKYYYLRNTLSTYLFNQSDGFSKRRNFFVPFVKTAITIYDKQLYCEKFERDINLMCVRDKLKEFIHQNIQKNKPSPERVGIYLQGEQANYSSDHAKIMQKLHQNIAYLERKDRIKWFVKVKPSDPLIERYRSSGLKVIDNNVNQELLMQHNAVSFCCRHDTFLLNMLLLEIPGNIYVRRGEESKLNYCQKIDVINHVLNRQSRCIQYID